jgi:hypothetical protein
MIESRSDLPGRRRYPRQASLGVSLGHDRHAAYRALEHPPATLKLAHLKMRALITGKGD